MRMLTIKLDMAMGIEDAIELRDRIAGGRSCFELCSWELDIVDALDFEISEGKMDREDLPHPFVGSNSDGQTTEMERGGKPFGTLKK